MTRDEAMIVRVGDRLIPDPRWNATIRNRNSKFPDVVVVKDVANRRSRTGAIFLVENIGKETIALDAGWFSMPGAGE